MAKDTRIELSEPLHRCAIQLLRMVSAADEQSGLSRARLSALSVIVFAGPLSLKALAGAENVSAPTMSRLVRALVEQGHVRMQRQDNDARQSSISATDKGRRLLLAARHRRLNLLEQRLERLSAVEQAQLRLGLACLEKILPD
ncbi:MarR family winged helix-turn-helix transcriptional regulator [Bowmanella dokdonensis]|uniref:MarR family transcriptional regulator n=1 Tax=Bowmanella dokdonensis TaxID=751969 RepID=A0A939INX6_9ALTE|nr:MarR family transcriptional regulator [Bowmanella dokdonensis]MBN7826828.1 MarR family transcriptional regulator [Bowmanella dokdonensis]